MGPCELNWLCFVIWRRGPRPNRLDTVFGVVDRRNIGCCGIPAINICRGSDRMCFSPKFSRSVERINASRRPPLGFVAGAVQFAMMATAQRHGEFIADLEAKSSGLGETQMVGVAGLPAADHAGLFGDKAKVNFVALSAWLGKGQHAFVDRFPGCFRLSGTAGSLERSGAAVVSTAGASGSLSISASLR